MDIFSTKVAYADLDSFIFKVNETIINPLIMFLFALAMVYFLWGVFEFILNQDNEEMKTTGKSHMFWGVVGLTVMMSVWAILGILQSTIGVPKSEINPETGHVELGEYNPSRSWFR